MSKRKDRVPVGYWGCRLFVAQKHRTPELDRTVVNTDLTAANLGKTTVTVKFSALLELDLGYLLLSRPLMKFPESPVWADVKAITFSS